MFKMYKTQVTREYYYICILNKSGQWAGLGGFGFKVVTQTKQQSKQIRLNPPKKWRTIFTGSYLQFKREFDLVRNK
jgi:hypothetical protein